MMVILFSALLFSSCGGYDKGYDAAWDEKRDGLAYIIDGAYKQGYDQGALDYSDHNQGCYDADAGNPVDASMSQNSWYMQGYKDCS